jgi:thiol:disulfide interchange protein
VTPIGYATRGLVVVGAALWIVSEFLPQYSVASEKLTFWEIYRYADIVTLVAAVAAAAAAVASLAVRARAVFAAVPIISGYLLAFAITILIEAEDLQRGAGIYIGLAGSTAIALGAIAVTAPALTRSTPQGREELPFMQDDTASPAAEPAAGWYRDPAGQARLRYWDGLTWSETTRS